MREPGDRRIADLTLLSPLNLEEFKGLEKGREEGRLGVARKMLGEGVEISFIANMTGLPVGDIERLKTSLT